MRSDSDILTDMIDAVKEHEYNRDCELDFYGEHGWESDYWTDEQVTEHENILTDIRASHDKLQNLIREATGDEHFTF